MLGGMVSLNSCSGDTTNKSIPKGEKIKLAVIGTGSRGNLLLELLMTIPTTEIVAICDNYEPNLKLGINITKGQAKTYSNHKEMIDKEKLDGVIVATPLYEHAHIVIDAFAAGLHVFCEKAMARTVDDCLAMVKASESAGKVFFLGHQRLFDPTYLIAMQMLKNNQIGK